MSISAIQLYFALLLLVVVSISTAKFAATQRILVQSQLLDCVSQAPIESKNEQQPVSSAPCRSQASESRPVGGEKSQTTNDILGTSEFDSGNTIRKREADENCSLNGTSQSTLVCSPAKQKDGKQLRLSLEVSGNQTQVKLGANVTIQCRFASLPNTELSFKLKWLRSVQDSQTNQSIADSPQASISVSKLSTIQRDGGLDLEIQDFQAGDAGNYFCQAVENSVPEPKIIDELRLELESDASSGDTSEASELAATKASQFSQENLAKLLPSLRVYPDYADVALGETVQLACVTSELDPDPEPADIQWSFESIDRWRLAADTSPVSMSPASDELPHNVSALGNILVVWSFSEEHRGLYRCSVELAEFNLSVQATGELALRPEADSAPLVFVTPELIRLSPNSSAAIQCEATGYPAPAVGWYRVDTLPLRATRPGNESESALPPLDIDGIRIENIPYRDALAYCRHTKKCQLINRNPLREPISGVSLIHIRQAKARHQGQYVCRASNKHGSNQASSIVDVEFREPPFVRIPGDTKRQTIVLRDAASPAQDEFQNVTFKCTIESGRPQPKLRWLRASTNGNNQGLNLEKNLDIYDLTKVSSATSNISTHWEDNGLTLALTISTISLDDEGDYVCLGENEWGRHSAVAHLLIRQPVSVRILQTSPMVAQINDSFHLDCLASGHPAPLDIEWSRPDRGAFFSLISASSGAGLRQQQEERAILKFDRVGLDEAGEYTCNARDPLNSTLVLRDTIMVVVEENKAEALEGAGSRSFPSQLPKLIVRPTRTNVPVGSNVTLDCLAISGLQPTLVEWIAPQVIQPAEDSNATVQFSQANIRPYYRTSLVGGQSGEQAQSQLLQFGSKLKIINASRAHEGVYQCKGRNRLGTENAPALIRVLEAAAAGEQVGGYEPAHGTDTENSIEPSGGAAARATKSKVARVGTNIELKCQVNGIEQPATSWSREGLELPATSVQIEHNLWIQNVSENDNGLYLCSARSKQPNHVIQARINLIVRPNEATPDGRPSHREALSAKIVASKSQVGVGDSLTLECIIGLAANESHQIAQSNAIDLDSIERNVVWTNLHSGQSVFQDNVYVQNNLLIIYELKRENSATYRCNYNELSQRVDFRLQVDGPKVGESFSHNSSEPSNALADELGSEPANRNWHRVELRSAPVHSEVVLHCPVAASNESFTNIWLRRQTERFGPSNGSLVFGSVTSRDADLFTCLLVSVRGARQQLVDYASVLLHVQLPVAKFVQRPVSFVSLPTISGASHQLNLELKFLAEKEHGLILFNGQQLQGGAGNSAPPAGDYILLGLDRGHLELRFELGDGPLVLRSLRALELNRWHKVAVERNRRGASMWIDGQPPISNSSSGKFFNLNLDSVLFVGGHQSFMALNETRGGAADLVARKFHGYSAGLQGCISWLRISGQEVDLIARNRSASVGIFECDKSECLFNSESGSCSQQSAVCQVDRSEGFQVSSRPFVVGSGNMAGSDVRCICLAGFSGASCEFSAPFEPNKTLASLTEPPLQAPTAKAAPISATPPPPTTAMRHKSPAAPGACEQLNSCHPNGTLDCDSLSSSSFKCHCKLGFVGETCAQTAQFSDETSVWFNQQAYLQFRLNKADEALAYLRNASAGQQAPAQADAFNATQFARLTSMAEHQNISFKLQTKSSYGLVFYTGQALHLRRHSEPSASMGGSVRQQSSKSVVANQLLRLASAASSSTDYLAIALVDGHVELSYQLGSGLAIIRSSRRVNDGNQHQIGVLRDGKLARLTIDESSKHEGSSPGKLSMLNGSGDVYLGGLPNLAELTNNMYVSGFSGCITNLEVNSLGPINLTQGDQLSSIVAARNLAPCAAKSALYKPTTTTAGSSDSDDPDEM